jgi:hypothetical protein
MGVDLWEPTEGGRGQLQIIILECEMDDTKDCHLAHASRATTNSIPTHFILSFDLQASIAERRRNGDDVLIVETGTICTTATIAAAYATMAAANVVVTMTSAIMVVTPTIKTVVVIPIATVFKIATPALEQTTRTHYGLIC